MKTNDKIQYTTDHTKELYTTEMLHSALHVVYGMTLETWNIAFLLLATRLHTRRY